MEPWRWNPDSAGSCCAVALGHASRKRLCVHVLGLRACVLARCAHACNAHAATANCRLASLSRETIHGSNMLIGRRCDCAEHASLLKLPPRIRRLTLRWDAMDM